MFDMKLLPVLVDVHDDDEYDDYYAHGHPLQTPTKQDWSARKIYLLHRPLLPLIWFGMTLKETNKELN